jgi:FlaA1/EpsC-like NDP-sugar epimerase
VRRRDPAAPALRQGTLSGNSLALRYPTELLGRAELGEQPGEIARRFAGQRVLVTGAGGSVGRQLAQALASSSLEKLVLLDHHEASLWELQRRYGDTPGVELVLADVRQEQRLRTVLARTKPATVIHLAAYKHVPFGEQFADEVFSVNVLATLSLIQQVEELGVPCFVYPSSDKACHPPSLYGATKRLSEMLVRLAARRSGQRFNIARFVNILGTQGSVIEVFAQQAQSGTPLSVTDPRMTRYWISMSEAVWLLLSVAEQAAGGQTLMLDCGDEIPVVEMARRVFGLVQPAAGEPELALGRPRPGERLSEVLLAASERYEPGPRPGLLSVADSKGAEHLALVTQLAPQLDAVSAEESGRILEFAMEAARKLQ